MRFAWRGAFVGLALVTFALVGTLLGLSATDRITRAVRRARFGSAFSRLVLKVMGFVVVFDDRSGGPRRYRGREATLFVANHISYLDAMVMAAHAPSVFLTSREIGATPGLGQISRAGGCLHVERRNFSTLLRDIDDISAALNDGLNVTLFPEGTTTDSKSPLLPFKSSLLESVIRSRGRVAPFCISYGTDGDRVAWYGDMKFLPHLLQLLTVERVEVRLTALAPLPFREHRSRKVLARTARDVIGRVYGELNP